MYKAVLTLLLGLMLSLGGGLAFGSPKVLPDGSPEEQYRFALGQAMDNDLETAEAAFAEFRRLHPGNEREADALFWLGRIQYLRQRYERAAITFSEFSRIYPDDARITDTTLWIAESVSRFAPAEQACTIYKELPNLVAAPTDQFTAKLAALSKAANCGFAITSSENQTDSDFTTWTDEDLCRVVAAESGTPTERKIISHKKEAVHRGIQCSDLGEPYPLNLAKKQLHDDQSTLTANLTSGELSQDELTVIRKHVLKNWSHSINGINRLKKPVKILVRTNSTGHVAEARIEQMALYSTDKLFRSVANAAQHAVVKASPLPINKNTVDEQVILFSFGVASKPEPPLAHAQREKMIRDGNKFIVPILSEIELDSLPSHNYWNEIYFPPRSGALTPAAIDWLRGQLVCLRHFPNMTVVIEGHTDERMTRDFSAALGAKRAAVVSQYLIGLGISPSRISTISYGKNRPNYAGSNMEVWTRQNRTVTVSNNQDECTNFLSVDRTSPDDAEIYASLSNEQICSIVPVDKVAIFEADSRNLNCDFSEIDPIQVASAPKPSVSSAELTAAQKEAQRLREELAALKAAKDEQQQTISADNQIPLIEVASQQKDEATALVYGRAKDNVGIADVLVNDKPVQIRSDGSFQTQFYIPPDGLVVEITAYDFKGNKASKTLSLNRSEAKDAAETKFAQLQPSLGKRGAINRNAIALIVGVEKYENLPAAPAIHADKDAEYFADFAHYKLGVPRNNIIKAINSDARRLDILKAMAKVTQLSKENETEVFIFFAGHGLAADDGEDVFLIPYDGDTGSFLAETAITRSEIFQKVERIGPKSVTVFLDACYTGGTRSQDVTLVANKRPVRVEALNQSVPQGFTILSASASDETSMALEAAEHGMFSYFLMKGMEGDADADSDNQITMAEMRDYVKDKVIRQSNFQQTPELQGDADKVLVRFQ